MPGYTAVALTVHYLLNYSSIECEVNREREEVYECADVD